MIGDMITKVRKEKKMTKTELANLAKINVGHLTHIEKGERNPSHKTLKNICSALNIPYQQLMYTYDKKISETQENYGSIKYISYNKVLSVDLLSGFVDCPPNASSASLCIKIPDNSMEPKFKKDSYVFIEFNSLLDNKDIGLFSLNKNILIRSFLNKKDKIILKPLNKNEEEIIINKMDDFYIIGKVLI